MSRRSEYNKGYRELNRASISNTQRVHYLLNKERILKRNREYHKLHREEILKRKKQYGVLHRKLISDRNNKYYKANCEKFLEQLKIYRKTPNGKLVVKASFHNRRVLMRGLTRSVIQQVYEENIVRFGVLTCELCFKPIIFGQDSLEHFHPISRANEYGGNVNERKNLGVAHGSNSLEKCNLKKLNSTLGEWFAKKVNK